MARKRITTLPDVPRDSSPATRRWMEAVKESLEVRLGRRGDPGEAAITFNDLVDAGIINTVGKVDPRTGVPIVSPTPGGGGGDDPVPVPPPVAPSDFVAVGVFGGIHLLWSHPAARYKIVYTEVQRSSSPDRDEATLLGASGGSSYFDIMAGQEEAQFHYWVRHVNINGDVGPWSTVAEATKPADTALVLERITGEIDESHLAEELGSRIDLIDGEGGLVEQVQEMDETFSQQLTTVQTRLDEDLVAVQETLSTEVERIDGELVALGARYTVQVQANGLVGGFGVYNDGSTVDAGFDVDRLWVGRTNDDKRKPFIVDGGIVYMDEALIRDASIQEGQIGPLTIGKLEKADGTPITTAAGLIRADAIDVGNLQVAEAATFTGEARSNNFPSGGWRLHPNGTFNMRSGSSGARLDIQGDRISVYDGSGRLRVRIGRL